MDYPGLPGNVKDSLDRYARMGMPLGGFLEAVISNDLMDAMGRADIPNREAIFPICQYIYNELPRACWGSREAYREWLKQWR